MTTNLIKTNFFIDNKKIPVRIIDKEDKLALSFPFYRPLIDELKESTENRQWDNINKQWVLDKTPRNKFILDYLQGHDVYAQYDTPLQNILEEIYTTSQKLLEIKKDFWKHQFSMYAHAAQRKQCIIAGEMRTGKTRPILKLITDLHINNAWWIAPKSALRGLKIELIKWNFPLEIKLLTYSKFRRVAVNANGLSEEGKIPRFIVFDECQKLKNPKSQQGQIAKELTQVQEKIYGNDRYVILLSGTPAPRDPSDWWNITEVACPGFLREGSKMTLARRLGEWEQKEGAVGQLYWHLKYWKEDEVQLLHERLNGLVEVYLKKDCLDLPNKIYTEIKMDISDEYKRGIKFIRAKETNPMTLQQKLRQLSDGFIYINEPDEDKGNMNKITKYFPNCPKDKQFRLHLEEYEDIGRMICYCGFTATIDKLTKIAIDEGWAILKVDGRGWSTLNTTFSVDECLREMDGSLNEGKIGKLLFLAQADSGSTGLELSASPVIVYYSNTDSGEGRMQSEDRPHSAGMNKEKGLEIIDYIHIPVDGLIVKRHRNKKSLQSITMGDINKVMEGL